MELLHSKILGEGRPLIILHGFLGMSDNWKSLGNQYANQGFEVHLVDQRNHGRSFWSEDFSQQIMADDLYNYINHHGLRDVNLLGHSMGGKTAMTYASTFSDSVEKLMVADIAPKFYPPHHQQIIEALRAVPRQELNSRSEVDEILSRYLSDVGIRLFLLKNLYRTEDKTLDFRFNLEVLSNHMEAVGEALPDDAQFNGPTLFLRGEKSDYIADGDMENIRVHFPAAQLETVSAAGHWLHAENPAEFFTKSLQFMNSQ